MKVLSLTEPYACGVYKEGRYAWVLENVTPLKEPVKAKGQLNIWNYYDGDRCSTSTN